MKPRAEEAFWDALTSLNDDDPWDYMDFPEDMGSHVWFLSEKIPTWDNTGFSVYIARQVPVDQYRLDFLFQARRWDDTDDDKPTLLIVEIDEDYHDSSRKQRLRDRRRDRHFLAKHGVSTIRFTEAEIYSDAKACALEALESLRRLSDRRRALLGRGVVVAEPRGEHEGHTLQ